MAEGVVRLIESESSAAFPTTSWTVLLDAGEGDRDALNELLAHYWRPVYGFLRRRGHQPADAADLAQSFLTDVLLGRNLAARADLQRGRFRSFLLQALKRFEIDAHRRSTARGAGETVFVSVDAEVLATAEVSPADDPSDSFDRLWAATAMNLAIEELERYLTSDGYADHWVIFRERVLLPAVHGTEPTPIKDLASRLGIEDLDKISQMTYSVRRRFRSTLARIVARTLDDPSGVDDELEHLRRFLALK